jgi:hypothetical protein
MVKDIGQVHLEVGLNSEITPHLVACKEQQNPLILCYYLSHNRRF